MGRENYPHLFAPIRVGHMEIKNRIFMPAMTTNLCDEHNCVTQAVLDYYETRAKGGAGLLTAEATMVEPFSRYRGKTNMGLYRDDQIPGMRKLAEVVHSHGAKLVVQLMHGGPACLSRDNDGHPAWAASPIAIRTGWLSGEVPREMPAEEIHNMTKHFAQAARRAKEAGLDGVEIHACHRHGLLGSFLSPLSNKRVDEYGGNVDGRLRFPLEVIHSVRRAVGTDFCIIVRISMDEFETGGQSLLEGMHIAQCMEQAGVDFLNLTRGTTETFWKTVPPSGSPKGLHTEAAQKLKAAVKIPVGIVGRINEPWAGELILADQRADAVYMGRALLCDPELPNKAADNRLDDIRPCMGCTDCIGRITGPVIHCALNPESARESSPPRPVKQRKKILVVGGGPAGLHAAAVAARRGHQVTLAERQARLGGAMYLAAVPNGKQDISHSTRYLIHAARQAGVQILCGSTVDETFLQNNPADEVIVAAGAAPIMPAFLQDAQQAVSALDILAGTAVAGRNVVVIGGGSVGCETAEFLIHPRNDFSPRGRKVTILEMTDGLARDDVSYARTLLMERLLDKGCNIVLGAKVLRTRDDTVVYCTGDDHEVTLTGVDTVVAAMGLRSNAELAEICRQIGCPVHLIGDAKHPARINDAMMQAQLLAEQI